jgi:hypothetical protein
MWKSFPSDPIASDDLRLYNIAQLDCHSEQAFLRSGESGRAARRVALFATQ